MILQLFHKLEKLIMWPFEWVFKFTAQRFSYTFAVAFTTSLGGFLIAAYIATFLSSMLHFKESGTGYNFLILFSSLSLLVYAPGYYLHFGLLYHRNVPCFHRQLNLVNRHLRHGQLCMPDDPQEAKELHEAMENLPRLNMIAALIYPSLVMTAVVVQEFIIGIPYNALIILLGISTALFIYFFATYIVSELLTGPMRKAIKRHMTIHRIAFNDGSKFSIRQKFVFITALTFLSMTELGLMFFFSSSGGSFFKPLLFIALTSVIVGSLLFFYLISIQNSLDDFENAATDLAHGGEGILFLRGLDRELINAGRGFISAASEVNEIRNNLEKKVEERTTELNHALAELKEKDQLLTAELNIAASIQQGILPVTPAEINGLSISGYTRPLHGVTGDFFDIIPMEGGITGILMGDVSGHGVPAALITTMSKSIFRDLARRSHSPREIIFEANEMISAMVTTQEYMTLFFLTIDSKGKIRYSNASHSPALLCRSVGQEIIPLDTTGLFVGALSNEEVGAIYEEKTTEMLPGDRIILYTDGFLESRNNEGEEFGMERFMATCRRVSSHTAEEARKEIIRTFDDFKGKTPLRDDITLLIIDRYPE